MLASKKPPDRRLTPLETLIIYVLWDESLAVSHASPNWPT
jgi:hypothetical protein